jgi:alkaline phosphatase
MGFQKRKERRAMVEKGLRKRLLLIVVLALLSCAVAAQAGPKYVFFFIGDGMGPEQVKAGGMYANGEAGTLSFESFPYQGELTTYSADNAVTDSAAAATALATSFKVNNGVISMAYPGDGSELQTLLEMSKLSLYKRVGLVTTVYMAHATPAAFGAHEPSRNNYSQIADDYLTQTRPNILFGGSSYMGGAAGAGYTVVTDLASMFALNTDTETMVSGQFGSGYMPYEYDGMGSLPHLSQMAVTATDILDNDPDGFFIMVEGGLIDQACHSNDIRRAVHEVVEFSNAVQTAIDWVNTTGQTDVLILVAADHETGGLTVLENNGAGQYPTVSWTTTGHTATNVPVYAWGVNAEMISAVMDNTDMWGVVTADPIASNPDPADGASQVALDAVLSWTPGTKAAGHDVYFGTSATPPFVQNQTETTFAPTLAAGTVYYWRIDEVNDLDPASPWIGNVWTFTTASAPGQASNPSPVNGATHVSVNSDLSWVAGSDTTSHDVFFGTDQTAVANANTSSPEFMGNQADTTYAPGTMGYGVTYYWRIDEVGPGGVTTGLLWSFTTETSTTAYADADIPVTGVVGGSYADTHVSDDVWQTITEKKSGGAPSTRYSQLEHKWTFSLGSADTATFYVEAHKTPSDDGDDFVFAYSTNDSSYTDMITVTSTTDTVQSYILPPGTSGTLYVRVMDTDRTAGNMTMDTISVDRMYIKVEAGGPPDTTPPQPDPMTWAVVPHATGSTSISMTATTATDASGVEYSFECTAGAGHNSGWQDSAAYEDTGLTPETQYTYRVQARDKSVNQNATAFSPEASATTDPQGELPGQATNPNPPDGGTADRKTVVLSWLAGTGATSHDVYLGTSPTLTEEDFQGNQTETTFDPPGFLGKMWYYWRIDEVNQSGTTTGVVWSFLSQ